MPYTTTEIINPTICDKLTNLSFGEFTKIYTAESDETGIIEPDLLKIYKRVKKYCKKAQSTNYEVKQTYNFALGKNQGRLFVDGAGLQNITRGIRAALSDGINTDLDMKNAHPTLLLYYTRQKNIPTNYLAQYIMNRERIMNNISEDLKCNNAEVKKLFLISINDNKFLDTYGPAKKKIKNEFLINFDKEMKTIQQIILNDPGNADLKKMVMRTDWANKENLSGSMLNHILCQLENECLGHITEYCIRENIQVDCIVFDGLMLRGDLELQQRQQLLTAFDAITAPYGIKWAYKPHELGFKQQLLTLTSKPKIVSYCGENIIEMSKYLYNNYFSSRLYSIPGDSGNRLFLKSLDSNLYITGNEHIYNTIKNWICEQDLYITFIPGEYVALNNNHKNPGAVVERIIELSAANNCDFMSELFRKSMNKLNFKNGILEVKETADKTVVVEFDDNPANAEGLFRIEYDLDLDTDYTELKQEIFRRIIDPIFASDGVEGYMTPEVAKGVRDCILYRLARSVFGVGINDKNAFFKCEGVRNSGKGILSALFETALGQYCKSVSSSNFIAKVQQGDAARNYAFLADQQFTRLLYTNEFEIQGKNSVINGSLIKSIIGRDNLEVRKLHQNPISIQTQCSLWMFANQYPEIVPMDCLEAATPWNMPTKFVNPDDKNRPNGYKYLSRDNTIKDWIKHPDHQVGLGFILILLDYVKGTPKNMPESIVEETNMDNDISTTEIINPLAAIIQYSPSESDALFNKDILTKLVSHNINISAKLLKSYMLEIGCIQKRIGPSRMSGYTNCQFI
jgi:hypothetical protein